MARRRALPGFGLSLGITLAYLGLLVLIPLSTVIIKTSSMTWAQLWGTISSDRAIASYGLSIGGALIAAAINVVFGVIVAWVLVRYDFIGRRIVDALVDLPFALPTAVAGIALTATWAPNGWLGKHLHAIGIDAAYSRLGVVIALTFIGLPFVVRTVQPVLAALDPRVEEAAATLGATRWQTFWRVIVPALRPAIVTGFALAFARALGEYGSVVFMSGNMPMKTEITPLLIMTKLEQFDYAGATALALVMLIASFAILIVINGLTWRRARRQAPDVRARPPLDELSGTERGAGRGHPPGARLVIAPPGQRPLLRQEPTWVRWLLIAIALGFLAMFLLLPLASVFHAAFADGLAPYLAAIGDGETRAAIRLTLFAAAIAVPLNIGFGLAAAWAITRFQFPGKRVLVTLIDLPFAVSPVIAGMLFVLLFGAQGYLGPWLAEHEVWLFGWRDLDVKIIFATPSIVIVTAFVTVPFVARELIPALEARGPEQELAALTLGATPWQTFRRVTLPNIRWSLAYGAILCAARAVGEFGAVSVVSGHIRGETNTVPLHVEILYNDFQYQAAFAVSTILIGFALATLAIKSALAWQIARSTTRR